MPSKKFAYARVSTKDQSVQRQTAELKKLVASERDIYIDKESGKDFDRPKYQVLRCMMREGDLLYITSIDRLGRNYKEIVKEWAFITQEIKADIKVLDMPMLDTTANKELLGTFISDMVLQVLSFVAEQERTSIQARQTEGIAQARVNGVVFGRPRAVYPENWARFYKMWKAGEISAVAAMTTLNLKKNTFYKLAKQYEFATSSPSSAYIQYNP